MRSLLWKEWRELRSSGPLATLFTLLVVLLFEGYDFASRHVAWSAWHADAVLPMMVAAAVSLISAGLIASRLFSAEVGSGTLQFLSSLPVSRRRLWSLKALSGLLATLVCAIGAVIGWIAAMLILVAVGRITPLDAFALPPSSGSYAFMAVVCVFAAGLFTSPLFDRVTGASVACVFISIAIAMLFVTLSPLINNRASYPQFQQSAAANVMAAIASIVVAALLRGSYRAFTRGESLRTNKRIGEALFGVLDVTLIAIGVPVAAFLWLIW